MAVGRPGLQSGLGADRRCENQRDQDQGMEHRFSLKKPGTVTGFSARMPGDSQWRNEMSLSIFLLSALPAAGADTPPAESAPPRWEPVPFTSVKLEDRFWAPRIDTNRQKTLPHNIRTCES